VAVASQEWYCHDLPGERLRVLTCGTVGGAEVQSETAVVDFHVVKAPAAAAAGATAGNAGGMPTILPSAE
jgi:predicted oxidoreductase